MKLTMTALMFLAMFAGKSSVAAESILTEAHSDWQSRMVYDNEQIRFRAITTYAEAGDYVVLTMDRIPNDCGVQYTTMNILASTPSDKPFNTDKLYGVIRVDEHPIHNVAYTLSLQERERVFFVNITNFDGEDTLLRELRTGRYLRFKLRAGKEGYFLRFSLQGYVAAEQRTLSLCRAFNKGKSNEGYFTSEPKASRTKIKNDESYF